MDQPTDRPMDKAGCWVAYMQVKFTNAFCLRVNRNNYQYQFAGLFWRIVFKVMFQSPRRLSAGLFNDKTSLAKIGINHDFLFFFAEKYFSLDRSFSSEASHADRDVQRNPNPPNTRHWAPCHWNPHYYALRVRPPLQSHIARPPLLRLCGQASYHWIIKKPFHCKETFFFMKLKPATSCYLSGSSLGPLKVVFFHLAIARAPWVFPLCTSLHGETIIVNVIRKTK